MDVFISLFWFVPVVVVSFSILIRVWILSCRFNTVSFGGAAPEPPARNLKCRFLPNLRITPKGRDAQPIRSLVPRSGRGPEISALGWLGGIALARLGGWWRDPLDRVQATISPLGYITTVNRDADGRTVSVQNASGYFNTTVFDNASRAIASVSPLGYFQTTIYDVANRVVGNQNALGQIYTAVLDAANRLIGSVNPLGYRSSAVFDASY